MLLQHEAMSDYHNILHLLRLQFVCTVYTATPCGWK